jgi:hypothetical protein
MDNLNPQAKRTIKIIIIFVISIVILIFFFVWISGYETSAKIEIDTSPGSSITVTRLNMTQKTAQILHGQSKLTSTFHVGSYSVRVYNKQFETDKTIVVKAHKNQKYIITLIDTKAVEPVTNESTLNISADANHITFLDPSDSNIYSVDNTNSRHLILKSGIITSIKWVNADYGVAQDTTGQLYLINGGSVSHITTPVTTTQNNYALTQNQHLYISNGSSVYEETIDGNFTQVYSINNLKVQISAASNDNILIQQYSINSQSGNSKGSELIVINVSGAKYRIPGEIYNAAWSPNGQYLVASGYGMGGVYDSQLKLVNQLPANNVTSPVWVDNNIIFYGLAENLWSYNLSANNSNLLADVSAFGYISQLTPDKSNAYVYVTIENARTSTGNYQLGRFSLSGQPVSVLSQELQVFLPNNINGCSLGYINFIGTPRITYSGSDTTPSQNCLNESRNYLQNYSLDPSSLLYGAE